MVQTFYLEILVLGIVDINHVFLQKENYCHVKSKSIHFKNNDGRKRSKYDRNIHKAMVIPDRNFQNNKKLFVTVHPNNACKLEFADRLWLPFLDQSQSDIIDFTKVTFHVYNILVKKVNM